MSIKNIISIFFNPIIKKVVDSYLSKLNQNINYEKSKRSLSSTVDYIEKNMMFVPSVDSKWKVLDLALDNVNINGLYLEFGVYKGETINYISKKIKSYIYGFDSFEGLPEFWRDGFPKEYFKIEKLPKVNTNVKLIKGLFDQTLPLFILQNNNDKVAFLHVDCDLYSSTKSIFKILNEKIVPGTIIVFDEYFNYPFWKNHEFKAFQEFIFDNNLEYEYITYNSLHEQVAIRII